MLRGAFPNLSEKIVSLAHSGKDYVERKPFIAYCIYFVVFCSTAKTFCYFCFIACTFYRFCIVSKSPSHDWEEKNAIAML